MTDYDFKAGKKRVEDILNNKLNVIEQDQIPSENNFTFENGYYGWVTGIFVDIRDSSTLFSEKDKEIISKIIRSFTSEVIDILRGDDNEREIGIRGDCVYAIYTTPKQDNVYECYTKCYWINTYMNMLNKLLDKKGFTNIKVGIGIATAQELVVKAGRKGVGINNSVWIGEAVTKASNLSSLGNKQNVNPIVLSEITYINIIDKACKNNANAKNWFQKNSDYQNGNYYHATIIVTPFNDWINEGMKD